MINMNLNLKRRNMSEKAKSGLKSAYELAMERMSGLTGSSSPLTNEQKTQIAEIENMAKARLAELEILFAGKEAKAAGDEEELAKLNLEFAGQVAAVRGRADAEKETVRRGP